MSDYIPGCDIVTNFSSIFSKCLSFRTEICWSQFNNGFLLEVYCLQFIYLQSNKHKVYPRTEQYGSITYHCTIAVNDNVQSNMVYRTMK